MKYCKYCKREYKCYELHITTNKHFVRKISTKEVRFTDIDKIFVYELSDKEKQDKIDNYNLIKKMVRYNRKEIRKEKKEERKKKRESRKRKREEFFKKYKI
jgi:hypothetical protein|tara:strand:+ start:2316 stop:2618 length:303 start_codon:yes stop_codon:yes gene_type:complete